MSSLWEHQEREAERERMTAAINRERHEPSRHYELACIDEAIQALTKVNYRVGAKAIIKELNRLRGEL